MELTSELALTESGDAETRTPGSSRPARALAAECPHCGSRAKHGERIGCCSGCKILFTSMSAFDKHRRDLKCLDPAEVGLVPKTLATDPSVMSWGWPSGGSHFTKSD